jgi:hypothetical protein
LAEGRPHLVAVGDSKPETAEEAAAGATGPNRLPLILLVVALVVCAFGWARSRSEVGRLSADLVATQQALDAASGRLAAEEARRSAVQGHLQGLQTDAAAFADRLAGLADLVAADLEPTAGTDLEPAADAQAIGNEAPPAD